MNNTKSFPIKDIALGIYDGPHATPPDSMDGPIFLSIDNVTDEGRLNLSEVKNISERDFPKWTRRVTPKKDDIVFSYEATLHRYAILPDGFRGCLGRRMALVRPNQEKIFPRFLYYYFLSCKWRSVIEANIISGATVDRIPIKKFPYFKVNIPALQAQKNIAGLVTPYDDHIDNNRRRIQLLEESGRLLFREWFVYFKFPNHEKVKIVDGVPEGWEKCLLGDFAKIRKGKNITFEQAIEGDIPVVGGGLGPTYYHNKANVSSPVITVSASGANAGFVNLYDTDIWASDCSYIDKNSTKYIFSLYLRLKSLQTAIFGYQVGAAQPHVYPKDLNRLKLVLAPDNVSMRFEQLVVPIFNLIKDLKSQNQKLAQARDLLLPRLMSGKIEV